MAQVTIDFDKLDDATTTQLKAALTPEVLEKLGVSPGKTLSRAQMEEMQVEHRVNGKPVTKSVWDWLQAGTKADGADAKLQQSSTAVRFAEAFDRVSTWMEGGEKPSDEDIAMVAQRSHEKVEDFVAAVEGKVEGGDKKAAATTGQITAESLAQAIKSLPDDVKRSLLPVRDQQILQLAQSDQEGRARKDVEDWIGNDIKNNPAAKKLLESIEDKSVREATRAALFGSSHPDAQRRIILLGDQGTLDDYKREISAAVTQQAELLAKTGISSKAEPQPIFLGRSEPGLSPVKVLSNEKPVKLDALSPTFEDDALKNSMLLAAQCGVGAATAKENKTS